MVNNGAQVVECSAGAESIEGGKEGKEKKGGKKGEKFSFRLEKQEWRRDEAEFGVARMQHTTTTFE